MPLIACSKTFLPGKSTRYIPYRSKVHCFQIAFLLFCLVTTLITNAQTITLTEKKASIEKVLGSIRQQTGYAVVVNDQMLKEAVPVTILVKNGQLNDVLKQIFQSQPALTFEIVEGKIITIRARKTTTIPPATGEKQIVITGMISDDKGNPVDGATVLSSRLNKATASGKNGAFTIQARDSSDVLVITAVNYENQVLELRTLKPGANADIVLSPRNSVLDDIIVIGYGTLKKSDLTGSVGTLKAEELQRSKAISFMEAMQGKVAGVQITSNSGEPGAAVNVNIRGANSFSSGTQPLYVIDGVQIDINNSEVAGSSYGNTAVANPLSSINPSDIASIEVLKDASATAIFGSRGANGVIIVSTKSGKANTSSLEFNAYAGVSSVTKNIDMLHAQDYAAYRYAVTPGDANWAMDTNGDGSLDAVKNMAGLPEYNWQDVVLRNALTQNYNINYSGGSNKTTFSTSLGYLNQEGLIIYNKYERYNLNFKLTHNATNRLRLGATINGSYVSSTGTTANGSDGPRSASGPIQYTLVFKPVNVPGEGLNVMDPDNSGLSSPADFMKFAYKRTPVTRFITDLYADFKIANGLNLRATGGGVLTNSNNKEWYPNTTSWGFPANGMAIFSTNNSTNWYQTTTLTYNKKIGQHSITALGGLEFNSYIGEQFSMRAEGFDIQSINAVDNINTAKIITQAPTTVKFKYNRISQFARVNYAYKNRYLVTGTLRRDGSSKFGSNYKYALFPSGAFAWRASEESFMKRQSFISDLKMRASFGITGNDRIPAYQALDRTYNTFYSSSSGTAELGLSPFSSANSGLRWETTVQYDAGIDLEILKGRIAITADMYLKKTKDLLVEADIPGQSGFLKQWQNIGRVDNKGIELGVNTINIKENNFSWSTSFNISINRNKVRSLGSVSFLPVIVYGSQISNVGRVIVGQPIGTGYGFVFDGIYQLSDFDKQPNGSYTLKSGVVRLKSRSAQPGDFKYKDLDNDGIIDITNDSKIISNSNPEHYGGFTNNFTYGRFDLSAMLQWSYGNDIIYAGRHRLEAGQGTYGNLTQEYWDNRWTLTNPSNEYAGLTSTGKTELSSYYIEDGSFLRLKNITLGFNPNVKNLKKLGLQQCRVYVAAENLHTWTSYKGFDPEIASYSPLLPGIDNISYPRSKTFTVGIIAKF